MSTSPMFIGMIDADYDDDDDDDGEYVGPAAAPAPDSLWDEDAHTRVDVDGRGEREGEDAAASAGNGLAATAWSERRESNASDSSVSTEHQPLGSGDIRAPAVENVQPQWSVPLGPADASVPLGPAHASVPLWPADASVPTEAPAADMSMLPAAGALSESEGWLVATTQLVKSLELDEAPSSSPGVVPGGVKVVRHLQPTSTDTSRTAPLPRRSVANRNSSALHGVTDHRDVVPRMNEAALVAALEAAAAVLEAKGPDGQGAVEGARRQLHAVRGLDLAGPIPAPEVVGSVARILAAAPRDEVLGAALAAHLARWSEREANAPLLCSGPGLDSLLALLSQPVPTSRDPACQAFANLCAVQAGAAALAHASTIGRLCGAVRAQIMAGAAMAPIGVGSANATAAGDTATAGGRGSAWPPAVGAPRVSAPGTNAGDAIAGGAGGALGDPTAGFANVMRGLKKIALSVDGRLALAAGGALQLVVEVSRAYPRCNAVIEQALRIVGNVAIDPEREASIVDSGCVQLLCAHLTASDAAVLSADTGALANLISNAHVRSIIVANGCVRAICDIVSGPSRNRPEVYKHASWLLTSLAVERESRAHVLAHDGLKLLVAHCERELPQYHEEGAWALANLSADVRNATPIVQAGALQILFRLVTSASPSVQLQATWVFANLSVVDDLKPQIGSHEGFVETLYACLDDTAADAEAHRPLRLQSIRTLANLAVDVTNRARVAKGLDTAVATLVTSSGDEVTQATLRLVVNLSYDAPIASRMLQEERLVQALVGCCRAEAEVVQQEAVLCIVNLSLDESAEATLVAAGALPPLVTILQTGNPMLQEQAAWALSNITTTRESKMLAIELGALNTLKALHRTSSGQMRQASTKIMNSLLSMVTPQSRKVFLPSQATIRDSHRGRSPLVDGSRSSSVAAPSPSPAK